MSAQIVQEIGIIEKGNPPDFIPFNALKPELFNFYLFRFSFGENTEEAEKRKSKS